MGLPPNQARENLRGRYPWAHWTRAMRLVHPLSSVCPFDLQETSSGHAGVPKEREPRPAPRSPPPHITLRQWPYSPAYPQSLDWGTTWDLVGQISTPFFPGDPTKHPACPPWIVVHPTEKGWSVETPPQRFRRVRILTHMQGRIVMPPEVSPPGHSIAALTGRPWLRTPQKKRVRVVTSVRGRTRTGRIWFRRTSPFET